MLKIDEIVEMLYWGETEEIQNLGKKLARNVQSINVFLQPKNLNHSCMTYWDNCAEVVCEREDAILSPYLDRLFYWISDMNCPGAELIFERLKHFRKGTYFYRKLQTTINQAKAEENYNWLKNLMEFFNCSDNEKTIQDKLLTNRENDVVKKVDIDEIIKLLDNTNSYEIQKKGLELADNIKCINAFICPQDTKFDKRTWDNCACILSKRTDEELQPYIVDLLNWIKDLHCPGAIHIYERLKKYNKDECFDLILYEMIRLAKELGDDSWLKNLLYFL